ncbi:hypothetical protein EsDP_00001172 [Epichloe bromicola]|uniref:Uncharacterized protein n=1 Tax=Epichloe bromicola TaxID=79588 RepID=A0ABQ0CH21_9HYPO
MKIPPFNNNLIEANSCCRHRLGTRENNVRSDSARPSTGRRAGAKSITALMPDWNGDLVGESKIWSRLGAADSDHRATKVRNGLVQLGRNTVLAVNERKFMMLLQGV